MTKRNVRKKRGFRLEFLVFLRYLQESPDSHEAADVWPLQMERSESFYVVEEGGITGNSKEVGGPFATREDAQAEANRLSAYATGLAIGLEQSMGLEAVDARIFTSYRVVEK